MPELAAHLERVAKELSERVVRALFDQGYLTGPTQDRLDAEDIAGEALKATLAAALAACARERDQALRESFIEAIREHPFDGCTLCKCRSEKFDIPMEELTREYPKINRYVFEAKQRKAYAEHVAEIAGAMRERAVGEKA